ncbi:MAG TPA: family 1 encapsulin nanocompartment shell protein [Burkholderiales bacterium]
MNDLLRALAPVSDAAWALIEEEAKRTLQDILAARKLVDFTGPLGWEASALNSGRARRLAEPAAGVEARLRSVQPLVELRVPFELAREELEAVARGAQDPELDAVRQAARSAGLAEDRAVFQGYAAAGIDGVMQAAKDATLPLTDDFTAYPAVVADAVSRLRTSGVNGPYAIALGPRCYAGLTKTTVGGYPVMEHVRRLLDGPIVWAPGVDGAVVLSQRGGDFELAVGQDFSLGYLEHSAAKVRLYLQESFTFRVLSPEAAVPLSYSKK